MRKIKGVTLLEAALALVIAMSLLLLSIRQYEQYAIENSFIDIKRNVDILFQALGQYYQANCRTLSDVAVTSMTGGISGPAKEGALSPQTITSYINKTHYTIDISSTLMNSYYLSNKWPAYARIVDTTSGYKGYTAAFILRLSTRSAYMCWNTTIGETNGTVWCNAPPFVTGAGPQIIQEPFASSTPTPVAFWRAQVAVKINNDPDGKKTLAFLGLTEASCASGVADSCDGSATPNYLIWQELPTKSGAATNSDLWESQAQEAFFNQQYSHDVVYEMSTHLYTQGNSNIDYYYVCGN